MRRLPRWPGTRLCQMSMTLKKIRFQPRESTAWQWLSAAAGLLACLAMLYCAARVDLHGVGPHAAGRHPASDQAALIRTGRLWELASLLSALAAIASLLKFFRAMRRLALARRRRKSDRCPQCGYDLRARPAAVRSAGRCRGRGKPRRRRSLSLRPLRQLPARGDEPQLPIGVGSLRRGVLRRRDDRGGLAAGDEQRGLGAGRAGGGWCPARTPTPPRSPAARRCRRSRWAWAGVYRRPGETPTPKIRDTRPPPPRPAVENGPGDPPSGLFDGRPRDAAVDSRMRGPHTEEA